MDIRNKSGVVLYEAKHIRDLSDVDLREAVLEGMKLQGVHFEFGNLEGANLRDYDSYWATFFGANLIGAIFKVHTFRAPISRKPIYLVRIYEPQI